MKKASRFCVGYMSSHYASFLAISVPEKCTDGEGGVENYILV
jgi:hypothetical protein